MKDRNSTFHSSTPDFLYGVPTAAIPTVVFNYDAATPSRELNAIITSPLPVIL